MPSTKLLSSPSILDNWPNSSNPILVEWGVWENNTHTCSLYGCGSNFVLQIVGYSWVYIYILHNTKNTACLKILKIKITHKNKLYKSGHYVTRTYQDHLRPCLDLLIAHFLQLLIDHPRRVSGGGPRQELTGLQALLLAYRRFLTGCQGKAIGMSFCSPNNVYSVARENWWKQVSQCIDSLRNLHKIKDCRSGLIRVGAARCWARVSRGSACTRYVWDFDSASPHKVNVTAWSHSKTLFH